MTGSPSLDWDRIDRAIGVMEDKGLHNVRGHGHDVHTATIDWQYTPVVPWMSDQLVYDSSAEVNASNKVVQYTFRFPGIEDFPEAPDPDAIELALTHAADKLPPGYIIDVVPRSRGFGQTTYAPHIRGEQNPDMTILQLARIAVQARDEYYDQIA